MYQLNVSVDYASEHRPLTIHFMDPSPLTYTTFKLHMPSPLLIFANLDRSFFPFIHLVNVPISMPSDFTYYRHHSTNLSSSSSLVVSLLYNAYMLKISTSKTNIKKNLPILLSFPHGINGWASLFPTPHQLFMTVLLNLLTWQIQDGMLGLCGTSLPEHPLLPWMLAYPIPSFPLPFLRTTPSKASLYQTCH